MRKEIYLILFVAFFSCQPKEKSELVADDKIYSLINFVAETELESSQNGHAGYLTEGFSILLNPGQDEYFRMNELDSIFKKEDIVFIHKQIDKRMNFRLKSDLLNTQKIIPIDSIQHLKQKGDSNDKFWERFEKKYKTHGFSSIDMPLFCVDGKTAVVTYGFHCGSLCGGGETAIFQLLNGKWKKIMTLSSWVS
ncbi:hypothetical protein HKT18_07925 [Flavobacterium sp. IMCC34852]|uniref:Lipoprotein n=1 Tax=Flavobacterium rivulicola TaxID=2732161 RepID=A0A7Y3VZ38_9FLAO|nr:hypothetical protein [Flavobacterium sp. IMCC34852]NNT72137.1 hypothetical protein [Flavobacterium sp. IMCC34852]